MAPSFGVITPATVDNWTLNPFRMGLVGVTVENSV